MPWAAGVGYPCGVKRATIGCLRVAVTCDWPGMPGPIPFGMGGWMAEARIELPMITRELSCVLVVGCVCSRNLAGTVLDITFKQFARCRDLQERGEQARCAVGRLTDSGGRLHDVTLVCECGFARRNKESSHKKVGGSLFGDGIVSGHLRLSRNGVDRDRSVRVVPERPRATRERIVSRGRPE
jgi:hypothetical protein